MEKYVRLRAAETVEGLPFTNPEHIRSDLTILRYMAEQICMFLEEGRWKQQEQRPLIVHMPPAEHWIYRLVLTRPEALAVPRLLHFVGFLGQRCTDPNEALASEFDATLIGELSDYPGLLSYSTMALVTGNFSNLVIFSGPEVKSDWSRSKAHVQAVTQLAPNYYRTVRIVNGVLPHGVHRADHLQLSRVKYFDYESRPGWQAVRELDRGDGDGT